MPIPFIAVVFGLLLCTSIVESKAEATKAEYGTITDDRDEKVYKTVKIGKQTWLAENLAYSKVDQVGKCYDNKPANCETYGRLYDWETAKKVCPKGWHLPSYNEWETLYLFIGGEDYFTNDVLVQDLLKAKSGWEKKEEPNNGTDDYGFTALPGGFGLCEYKITSSKIATCTNYKFGLLGNIGSWWTATKKHSSNPPECWLIDAYPLSIHNDLSLMSVRCVKN